MAKYRKQPQSARRRAYIRSCLPACCTFLVFSTLLTSLGLLAHFHSPAAKQRIGWQSWDLVIKEHKDGDGAGEGGLSLPLDVWDPLLPHSTGLTEVTVSSCYLSPALFPAVCMPPSSSEDDKLKGKWVRVEKDLNLRTGIWYLSLYYRRTHRLDAPIITDLRIAPFPVPTDLASELDGWVIANGDLRSGVWPQQETLKMYYKLSETPIGMDDRRRQGSEQEEVVTDLDVVFGDDDPFYGFERVVGGPVVAAEGDRWESVDIAYKRGLYEPPKAKRPVFHDDGTFKIMQIADLHYSVGKGECRDTDLAACDGDNETAKWLASALDEEKPDLVVFSGDQLNGQKSSYDTRSVLAKFARPVIDREIPWAAIFGNHDSEINEDREYQMHTLSKMPYSLARPGPKEVDGFGNYLVKIRSPDDAHTHLFTLYFMDSGDYMGRTLPWEQHKYDYIKPSQVHWYRNVSSHIPPLSRPYRPPSSGWSPWHRADPSTLKRRLDNRQSTIQAKPNAIMWFHIPLQEAYDDPDVDEDGHELDVGEVYDIGSGASEKNSGMLENGILQQQAMESGGEMGEGGGRDVPEVKVLAHGHCHLTERCRRVKGVWMCFDGGSSYSGYGKADFDRRVRVYQLSEYGEKVETYKRLTTGEVIDRQVLVGA